MFLESTLPGIWFSYGRWFTSFIQGQRIIHKVHIIIGSLKRYAGRSWTGEIVRNGGWLDCWRLWSQTDWCSSGYLSFKLAKIRFLFFFYLLLPNSFKSISCILGSRIHWWDWHRCFGSMYWKCPWKVPCKWPTSQTWLAWGNGYL